MQSTSIHGAIVKMGKSTAPALLQGTVIATDPLKIQIANDSKLVISELITVIPWHLTDYETEVDIEWKGETSVDSNTTTEAGHAHKLEDFNIYKAKITVRNALKVGDILDILALNGGKKYYILDRVKK